MLKKTTLKSLFLFTLLLLNVSIIEASTDINTTETTPFKTPPAKGYIFDSFKAELLYGAEYSTLRVKSEISDPDFTDAEGNSISLADPGEFAFKGINSNYKELRLQIFNWNFTYSINGTDVTLTSAPWDIPTLEASDTNELFFLATQYLGGYGNLEQSNTLLGHVSRFSLIYREAEFEGYYKRGDYLEKLTMNKNQYGVKYIIEAKSNLFYNTESYSFYKFYKEESTFPQVIYFVDGYNDLDEHFTSDKYTLTAGVDYIKAEHFIYGLELGLGLSQTYPGQAAKKRLEEAGMTNISFSDAVNLFAAVNLGYQHSFVFEYTAFNFNILYNGQYLDEFSFDTVSDENDDGKMEMIYGRSELVNNLKINLSWSF